MVVGVSPPITYLLNHKRSVRVTFLYIYTYSKVEAHTTAFLIPSSQPHRHAVLSCSYLCIFGCKVSDIS